MSDSTPRSGRDLAVAGSVTESGRTRPETHTVTVGSNPYGVAVAQNLGRAFVVNDGSVSVLSLVSHRQLAEFDTFGFHGQNSITLAKHDLSGYITNNLKRVLTVIDTEKEKVTKTIRVGDGAIDSVTAQTTRGERVFAVLAKPAAPQKSGATNQVVAVSTRADTVVRRTTLPGPSYVVAASPDGKQVWAGSLKSGRVWVLDSASGAIVRTIAVPGSGPVGGIAFSPDGSRAWVGGLAGVSVVSTTTGRTLRSLSTTTLFPQGAQIGSIALTADGRTALVENSGWGGAGSIRAVSTVSGVVRWRVPAGTQAEGLAIDQERGVVYATDYATDQVTWFRLPDGR